MNILFFGAGVIGSILAGKLSNAGETVTILDREPRLTEIQAYGILLDLLAQARCTSISTPSLDRLTDYVTSL